MPFCKKKSLVLEHPPVTRLEFADRVLALVPAWFERTLPYYTPTQHWPEPGSAVVQHTFERAATVPASCRLNPC